LRKVDGELSRRSVGKLDEDPSGNIQAYDFGSACQVVNSLSDFLQTEIKPRTTGMSLSPSRVNVNLTDAANRLCSLGGRILS
jgi:hypothetical protein